MAELTEIVSWAEAEKEEEEEEEVEEGDRKLPIFCNLSITETETENCTFPVYMESLPYTVTVYGYVSPVVVLLTVVTNIFVCIVLMKKKMRSTTNMLLVAMAISDMLTGLFPAPIFFLFYTLGRYVDYVPFEWCYVTSLLTLHLPTVSHTASIWLTVALSIQRYVFVCHSQRAKTLCTVSNAVKAIVGIYLAAFASQVSRFFEYTYHPVELDSLTDPTVGVKVIGCYGRFAPFVQRNLALVLGLYWWFRVVFIHLVPCALLVVFNALLFEAMRDAQVRRAHLLRQNRKTESRCLAETNLATLMLVAVIGVFLLLEFPLAVLMLTMIYENSTDRRVMGTEDRRVASLFLNLLTLFSYPVNFFIYCGMSRNFRQTLRGLFTAGREQPSVSGLSRTVEIQSKNGAVHL